MQAAEKKLAETPETAADVHSASDEYAARFGGSAGQWMLTVQERIVLKLLGDDKGISILDVGGGHAQIAGPLLANGYSVTVFASEEAGLHQVRKLGDRKGLKTAVGSLLALPYPDKSFDAVLCFRLLPHCDEWRQLIRELSRVSRRLVIADYPTDQSINKLTPMLFGLKKNLEKNTRPYTLFSDESIEREFAVSGFRTGARVRQFFLPMVLHRMLKTPAISAALEALPRVLGLTKLFGSPVIVSMQRPGS